MKRFVAIASIGLIVASAVCAVIFIKTLYGPIATFGMMLAAAGCFMRLGLRNNE